MSQVMKRILADMSSANFENIEMFDKKKDKVVVILLLLFVFSLLGNNVATTVILSILRPFFIVVTSNIVECPSIFMTVPEKPSKRSYYSKMIFRLIIVLEWYPSKTILC